MSNFYTLIADTARGAPGSVAIELFGDGRVLRTTSYGELIARAERVAAWLTTVATIEQGDRVAILSANDADWVAAYLGILRNGAVAVPLDTAYSPEQVAVLLADCEARVVLASARLEPTALEATARLSRVRIARLDDPFETTAAGGPDAQVSGSDTAAILYTSGTTADPKGVVLTHANLHAERDSALAIIRVDGRDAVLGVLPLFHALALMANLLLPLSAGSRVVFLQTLDSPTLLAALQARPITVFACVPQFFYVIHQRVLAEIHRRGAISRLVAGGLVAANGRLRDWLHLNLGPWIFARVHHTLGLKMRYLITGGSRFDPRIARDLYGLGLSLLNGYGLTETSGAATVIRPGDIFTTSVGPPLPGVEIRIAPEALDDDQTTPTGEILVRGGIIAAGYFHRPDATAAAIDDGWLRTGDLGHLDRAGRLYITGRKKEVIVLSSGKNLYPEEIEAHYRQSPFIRELCVLGLSRPGTPAAERLHAVIVPDEEALRARGVVNVGALIRFELEELAVRLPAHKRVLTYDIAREPLPRTTTGKLRRSYIERQLASRAAAETPDARSVRTPGAEDETWLAQDSRADLLTALAVQLGRPDVAPSDNLELDLGLDSMERVELLTALETRQGRRVAAEIRAGLFTVRQLIDAVITAPSVDTPPPAPAGVGSANAVWHQLLSAPPDPAVAGGLSRPTFVRASVIGAMLWFLSTVGRLVVRVRVDGRDGLPPAGPYLLCPNHQSYLDGFFVVAALPFRSFRQLFLVGASEYFESRLMAWIARVANIVPVDADANLVSAMRAAATGLALGKVLVLFPEGERSIDGQIRPFRKGAAILATHLAVPIVPVAVGGLHEIWPRGRSLQWRRLRPWRRAEVVIRFGTPLTAGPDYDATTARLQQRVTELAADSPI